MGHLIPDAKDIRSRDLTGREERVELRKLTLSEQATLSHSLEITHGIVSIAGPISADYFGRGSQIRKELRGGQLKPPFPPGRVPRISRLMALAIRFDQLVRDGAVADYAEVARLGHVTGRD